MNGRFLLDTNIFVHLFDKNAQKKAVQATNMIRRAIEGRQGIVSYHVVQGTRSQDLRTEYGLRNGNREPL